MSDHRFEELMSRLLDEELTSDELSELVRLAKNNPQHQDKLQSQLEAAEMLAQSEDDLRTSSLFVAALESRIVEDPFVAGVRSTLTSGRTDRQSARRKRRVVGWSLAAAAVVTVLLVAILPLFTPPSETEIAKITELNGSVRWTGDGGQVDLDLQPGRLLHGGTIESLATDSWVEIEFRDGSKVNISGQSVLTISERQQKELHLREGSLSANVKPQPTGKSMLIDTPTAQLQVLGTQFNVDAELSSTVLTVNEGSVRVTRLADGSVVDVPADHQIVAAATREAEFKATPCQVSVNKWQSRLPQGLTYGKWVPESAGLRAAPLLWRDCEKKAEKPILLYLAAVSVSRVEQPVALQSGARFRIRGQMDSAADLIIGLTTQHPKGGFAGKYLVTRQAGTFSRDGGEFELKVRVEDFTPKEPGYAESPVGLEVFDWWSLTINVDAGLTIFDVELLPPEE